MNLDVLILYGITGFLIALGIWRGVETAVAVFRRVRQVERPTLLRRSDRWQAEKVALTEWQQTFDKVAGVEPAPPPPPPAPRYDDYQRAYAFGASNSRFAYEDLPAALTFQNYVTLEELRRSFIDHYEGKA